ncbi:MAG: aldolase/citrate lyase family protein [Oscillospiraceae bacterium]|nr:aldolase/citrate lyase family protein [Oscillospiraceae bacterium]
MTGVQLLEKLAKRERIYGTLITSTSPAWIRRFKSIGLDFVFIDTEHTPMDRSILSLYCNVYKALEIAPMTRIPTPSPYDACIAIDAGSNGVLGPYIEEAEQVIQLVGAVKYRPLKGQRLQDVLHGYIKLTQVETEFFNQYNRGNFLFVNIESTKAMDNLDEILSVEGLDGIVIGPQDLSISLGVPEIYDSKEFLEAVDFIIAKAKEHGKSVGNHFSAGITPELEWAKNGMNIILHSQDQVIFTNYIRDELNQFRALMGDPLIDLNGNPIL